MTGKYVQHNYPRNAAENHIQQNGQTNDYHFSGSRLDGVSRYHCASPTISKKKKLEKCIKQLKKDSEDRGKKTVCIRTI